MQLSHYREITTDGRLLLSWRASSKGSVFFDWSTLPTFEGRAWAVSARHVLHDHAEVITAFTSVDEALSYAAKKLTPDEYDRTPYTVTVRAIDCISEVYETGSEALAELIDAAVQCEDCDAALRFDAHRAKHLAAIEALPQDARTIAVAKALRAAVVS